MRTLSIGEWLWRLPLSKLSARARLLYLWLESRAEWPGVQMVPSVDDLRAAVGGGPEAEGALAELEKAGYAMRYGQEAARMLWLPLLPTHQTRAEGEKDTGLPLPQRQDVDRWRQVNGDVLKGEKKAAAGAAPMQRKFGSVARRAQMRQAARVWLDSEGIEVRLDEEQLQKLTEGMDVCRPEHYVEAFRLFMFWAREHGHDPARCRPTRERLRAVVARLVDGYAPETLRAAVRGILRSDWHTGSNPEGKSYCDLTNVCKDGRLVEKFAALSGDEYESPAEPAPREETAPEPQRRVRPMPEMPVVFRGPRRRG
jgi:hypothetical protein